MDWLALLKNRLSEPRYQHSLGVMETARNLAQRWGCDPEIAATAGILHDITKEMSYEDQLALLEKYGMSDAYEAGFARPLHSLSGAYYIKHELGISDTRILSAVRWHTTAKADMNTYEKIIYVADFIEPNRNYGDVEFYRSEAFRDLDNCCFLGLKWNLISLLEQNRPVHRASLEAYHYFLKQERN